MGPYKPLRTWVDEFIPYYMEIMGVDSSPIAQMVGNHQTSILNWLFRVPGR